MGYCYVSFFIRTARRTPGLQRGISGKITAFILHRQKQGIKKINI